MRACQLPNPSLQLQSVVLHICPPPPTHLLLLFLSFRLRCDEFWFVVFLSLHFLPSLLFFPSARLCLPPLHLFEGCYLLPTGNSASPRVCLRFSERTDRGGGGHRFHTSFTGGKRTHRRTHTDNSLFFLFLFCSSFFSF